VRLRAGTPWIFLGSAMIALALCLGWLGLRIHNNAEATRARMNHPMNFSRDNDRIWLGEADQLIKTLTIVAGTFACLGVYVIGGGKRMNKGGSLWSRAITRAH
jgi:hypothetical protein